MPKLCDFETLQDRGTSGKQLQLELVPPLRLRSSLPLPLDFELSSDRGPTARGQVTGEEREAGLSGDICDSGYVSEMMWGVCRYSVLSN